MRTLHVAAMPFPSAQGTQALLHQMLHALHAAGHDTHLLCYAHGGDEAGAPAAACAPSPSRRASYTVHRLAARGFTQSLRSGPSLDKLWLDAALQRALPRLIDRLQPDLVVAHHVEAAGCALLARAHPLLFVAHTSLSQELPSYVAPPLRSLAAAAGRGLDRALIRRLPRTLAVSPLLAELLTRESDCLVRALSLPWQTTAPIDARESCEARRALGLSASDQVALYAGNLDAYQGLELLLPALEHATRHNALLRWLIATESATQLLRARMSPVLAERVTFTPLAGEAARRRVHAAADWVLVPRMSAGGVPVKLLDALARGMPVLAGRLALAGLPLDAHCIVVESTAPEAWLAAIDEVGKAPARARARALSGQAYVARTLTGAAFVEDLLAHARALQART